MKGVPVLLLPPAAEAAWHEVGEALAGGLPPCSADPERWFSHDAELLEYATRVCSRCPARDPCADFGAALGAAHGVWGGEDRGRQAGLSQAVAS